MALTHLIVGAGNMGGAILASWLDAKLVAPRNLAVIDPAPGTDAVFAIERGARHLSGADDVPKSVDTVLLAVKPQLFGRVRSELSAAFPEGALIVSIMAGVSLSQLASAFPGSPVIRAMPNTPAAVGKGVSAYVCDDAVGPATIARVEALLGATGAVLRVGSDDAINAVTAISGSGPAYIFHLVEALTGAAQALGLPAETAAVLARETVVGAAALLDSSERSPTALREAVTSPGGTTQAALDVLMREDGLGVLMRRTTRAAMDRSRELSGKT